jgi:hypothetical protein
MAGLFERPPARFALGTVIPLELLQIILGDQSGEGASVTGYFHAKAARRASDYFSEVPPRLCHLDSLGHDEDKVVPERPQSSCAAL